MLGTRRTAPRTIAGPAGVEDQVAQTLEALFPGSGVMKPKFPLTYVEFAVGPANDILGLEVRPFAARYTPQTKPTALRVAVGDKVVSYSGDGEFTTDLCATSWDAGLFVAECHFQNRPDTGHVNYNDIQDHKPDFGARRTVLTRLDPETLAVRDQVIEDCVQDGMVIRL